MNLEKVRALAEQAGDSWDDTLPSDKEFLARFAELIVEECLNIIGTGNEFCSRPKLVEKIKKHFGVEE